MKIGKLKTTNELPRKLEIIDKNSSMTTDNGARLSLYVLPYVLDSDCRFLTSC